MRTKLVLPRLVVLLDMPNEADGALSRMTVANGDTLTYQYDELKRLLKVVAANGDGKLYTKKYEYFCYGGAIEGMLTTNEITELSYSGIGNGAVFNYTYDDLGNIATYNGITYGYDDLGQLTSVTKDGVTTAFTYDTAGNIREVRQGATVVDRYTYGNNNWKDLLTAFNGGKIAYEGQPFNTAASTVTGVPTSGNPISYFNGTRWSFDWQNGRQLASASATNGDTTIDIAYTYDINGLRTSKTITRTTGGGTAHTHEYTSSVTAPTCTTAGYTTYTCECGESYVDNLVDALGHNYVASGNVYTCTRCGDSYTGHEHSYTETTTEPTCTEAGYTVYTCSCGDSYQVDLPALGHDYVMINQDVSGKRTYRCTRCGATYTDSGVGINPPIDPDPPVEYSLRNSNVTVTTEHHEYVYASGKLLREVITTTDTEGNTTTETLDFTYDASGSPFSLTYNGTTYYYVVNLQGDVIRLVSGNGATVAEYRYGPYGEVLTASGAMAEVNPLRYRGYYADVESGFYYLQSRFYDPAICRFVNADGYASTGQGFLGQNMFAYCGNNPINRTDFTGESYIAIGFIIGLVAFLTGCSAEGASARQDLAEANSLLGKSADELSSLPRKSYNCYGNGIGKQVNKDPGGYQPGDSTRKTFESVKSELGGDAYVRELNSITDPIADDEFRVAMKCGPTDYHFIRQLEDGTWYNKSGTTTGLLIPEEYVVNGPFGDGIWYGYSVEYGLTLPMYTYETIYFAVKIGWDTK